MPRASTASDRNPDSTCAFSAKVHAASVLPTATTTSKAATPASRLANAGFRRHHRQARSAGPTGRATIGSPA